MTDEIPKEQENNSPAVTKPVKRNVFKENWLKVDETCPGCGQITKRQKGMTKQNLQRLIKPKFDFNEILITFMLIMVVVLALVYNSETKQCREWLTSMAGDSISDCKWNCNSKCDIMGGNRLLNETLFNGTNGLNGYGNELNALNGLNLNSSI